MRATLSRQDLYNWPMAAAIALKSVYKHIKKYFLFRIYIHADVTTSKVINDKNKDSKPKKYICLYMSSTYSKPMILYDYQNTRLSSCPKSSLGDFNSFLQTYAYNGYNSVSNTTGLYFLEFIIKRYFHNIIVDLNEEHKKNKSILRLFLVCKFINLKNSFETLIQVKKIIIKLGLNLEMKNQFKLYIILLIMFKKNIKAALPRSHSGKALDYAKKHYLD